MREYMDILPTRAWGSVVGFVRPLSHGTCAAALVHFVPICARQPCSWGELKEKQGTFLRHITKPKIQLTSDGTFYAQASLTMAT